MSDRVLLLPPAATATASRLAEAAAARGLQVRTLHRRPVPPHLRGRAHVYGGEAFASEVASALDVALLVPAPGWLPGLPAEFAGRHVRCASLGEARRLDGPIFVKPAQGKAFPPGVYEPDISTTSAPVRPQGAPRPMAAQHPPAGKPPAPAPARPQGAPRPEATQRAPTNEPFSTGLPDETPVLLSDPVTFAGEYRLHVLDGKVHAASRYATHGILDAAPLDALPERAAVEGFAADLLAHTAPDLPSAVVVDVGLVTAPGPPRYAVVEANEAWFSNCYAAPPDRVLDVVLRAAAPRADLAGVTGAVGQPPGPICGGARVSGILLVAPTRGRDAAETAPAGAGRRTGAGVLAGAAHLHTGHAAARRDAARGADRGRAGRR